MLDIAFPWIWLLLPLPWLIRKRREGTSSALKLPALAKFGSEHITRSTSIGIKNSALLALWLLLLAAASQPRWIGEQVSLPQQGREMMLVLDLSGSMDIQDMRIGNQYFTRLDTMKMVLQEFVAARQGDRIGLILFADAAYQQAPLTFDLASISQFIDEIVMGLVGQRTAIGEGVGLAVKRLNSYASTNKVIVLLSDGASNAGNIQPLEALQLAKGAGVKIHTIGLGAEQMVQQSIFGQRVVNPSQDLDEPLLIKMAEETGGRYFRARNPQELQQIYQVIDQLEPITREELTFRPQRSLMHYPLMLAFLLSLVMAGGKINWQEVKHRAR